MRVQLCGLNRMGKIKKEQFKELFKSRDQSDITWMCGVAARVYLDWNFKNEFKVLYFNFCFKLSVLLV